MKKYLPITSILSDNSTFSTPNILQIKSITLSLKLTNKITNNICHHLPQKKCQQSSNFCRRDCQVTSMKMHIEKSKKTKKSSSKDWLCILFWMRKEVCLSMTTWLWLRVSILGWKTSSMSLTSMWVTDTVPNWRRNVLAFTTKTSAVWGWKWMLRGSLSSRRRWWFSLHWMMIWLHVTRRRSSWLY